MVLISTLISTKFVDDKTNGTGTFAKIGGLKPDDAMELELEFLRAIDFKMEVSTEEFDRYMESLFIGNDDKDYSAANTTDSSSEE